MSEFHEIKKPTAKARSKQKQDLLDAGIIAYTFKGEQDYLDDQNYPIKAITEGEDVFARTDVYAIQRTEGGQDYYYVKRGKYGKLYNPIGMYSEGTQNKQFRHAGKPAWEFKKTNKKIFTYYINFLRTRNLSWLNNADREV